MKIYGPMVHAAQLLRELGSQAFGEGQRRLEMNYPEEEPVSTEDTHTIAPSTSFMETVSWLRMRQYRVVITSTPGAAVGGLLFGRKNEPARIGVVGDVLVWDGNRVTIKE